MRAFSLYLLRRLARAASTLLIVALIVFAVIHMIPGDPALAMLGESADQSALDTLRHDLGIDRPLPVQFMQWLWHMSSGDMGTSISTGLPVGSLILDRFSVTASIVIPAILLAVLIAVGAGLAAAARSERALDRAVVWAAAITMAIPSFWLGLMLLLLFGVKLGWLPVVGFVPLSDGLVAGSAYLILPVLTLTIVESGVLIRLTRASAIEVLGQDFVMHARAKGLPEGRVLLRHVLPNAFAPTLTLAGTTVGHLLGGAAVVETVFTLPGLGRLMVDAVLARDYPLVQGCLLFSAAVFMAINLVVDLVYPLLDPRLELSQ